MKGYIKNKNIILIDPLPEDLQDGDEVEVSITPAPKQTLPFPTFNLGIKDEYLERDRIYEEDSNSKSAIELQILTISDNETNS